MMYLSSNFRHCQESLLCNESWAGGFASQINKSVTVRSGQHWAFLLGNSTQNCIVISGHFFRGGENFSKLFERRRSLGKTVWYSQHRGAEQWVCWASLTWLCRAATQLRGSAVGNKKFLVKQRPQLRSKRRKERSFLVSHALTIIIVWPSIVQLSLADDNFT